jgi:hypothetical protein
MSPIKTIVNIAFIIWSYYLAYYIFLAIINPIPGLGDGRDYHMPISESIINGSFLHPVHFNGPQWYYPGSSEAFNSILMLVHIPLTLSNIFPIIILFFLCFRLGMTFRLKYYTSLLFALTFVTLNLIVRWYIAISIDMWVAVFFVWAILLLENPQKSFLYFAKLGFVFGMLIGSKYTALYFIVLLSIVYWRSILININLSRFIIFLIPFSLFGLFWYVRNYIYTTNPFFPFPMLGFKGPLHFINDTVWMETLRHPMEMFNAYYGEYNIWSILIFIALGIYIFKKIKNRKLNIYGINRLYIIGIVNLLLYFTFPTDYQTWIMVSSFRYSYPTFIPLILCVFLLASYYKKEVYIGFFAIGSMLMVLTMTYYPKLTPIYIALAFLMMYIAEKFEKKFLSDKSKDIIISKLFQ